MAKHSDPIEFERIRDQSYTESAHSWATAVRNRAKQMQLSLSAIEQAADIDTTTAQHWLSGYDVPATEAQHNALLELLQLPETPKSDVLKRARQNVIGQWQEARGELENRKAAGDVPAFNANFLMARAYGRAPSAELERARQSMFDKIGDSSRDGLRGFICQPPQDDMRLSEYFMALCELREMSPGELSHSMGFDSSVMVNWTNGKSLPRRENFEHAQTWLRQHYGDQAASTFTHLYICEAAEKFAHTPQFRNMPREFWEEKTLLTNNAEHATEGSAPTWIDAVRPAQHRGEYVKAFRRAIGVRTQEFCDMLGITPGGLYAYQKGESSGVQFEAEAVDYCRMLDEEHQQSGAAALWNDATFEQLPRFSRGAPKTTLTGEREVEGQAIATGDRKLSRRLNDFIKFIGKENENPHSYASALGLDTRDIPAMATMSDADINTIANNARRYVWIDESQVPSAIEKLQSIREAAAEVVAQSQDQGAGRS